jgi:glycosyltransferase involved in cell wall biosynthesis
VRHLLFITERFPPDVGGLASSAGRITETLSQLGIEVDILTWSRYLQAGEVLPPAADAGMPRVYRVGLYRHWDMTMPQTLNVLEWLHQSRRYDAVWGHYLFPGGFLATWFAALNKLASTVSVRGNDIDRAMFPPGDFARLQWTLQKADLVTSVSADLARKIELLSQREDVMVLKNAVNEQTFSPSASEDDAAALRASLGIAENEVVLGFAGELREKKGSSFLLQALTTVRAKRPACLLIIGEVRASQEAALQVYAAQHPEDVQRIIITGHLPLQTDVAKHLRLCDVYLQPSLWEGMPNALLEAMACGCCCIVSDAGGIIEIIEHGKNGFIVGRPHLHRLGEAVLECLELPLEVRRQIEVAARDRIHTEYSLEMEKLRLQEVLTRLMPNSS